MPWGTLLRGKLGPQGLFLDFSTIYLPSELGQGASPPCRSVCFYKSVPMPLVQVQGREPPLQPTAPPDLCPRGRNP